MVSEFFGTTPEILRFIVLLFILGAFGSTLGEIIGSKLYDSYFNRQKKVDLPSQEKD